MITEKTQQELSAPTKRATANGLKSSFDMVCGDGTSILWLFECLSRLLRNPRFAGRSLLLGRSDTPLRCGEVDIVHSVGEALEAVRCGEREGLRAKIRIGADLPSRHDSCSEIGKQADRKSVV